MNTTETLEGSRPEVKEWLRKLAETLRHSTGEMVEVAFRPSAGQVPAADWLWWRCLGAVARGVVWVGVAKSAWRSLAGPNLTIGGEAEIENSYAALLNESWGCNGEMTAGKPSRVPRDVVQIQLSDLAEVELFLAIEERPDLEVDPPARRKPSLDLILDIELPVTLRFGRTRMTLDRVLTLDTGSVVEFERRLQEPVELLVNGRVVARGEAVTVEGNYAIRVSEIVSRRERLDSGSALALESR